MLKWTCQVFSNLAVNGEFRRQCNEYVQNSLYSQEEQTSQETAVSLLFSLVGRLSGANGLLNKYVANLVLQSALEALIQMLESRQFAEMVGLKMKQVFQILSQNMAQSKDLQTRGFLVGLAARLSCVSHNAQILLESNIINYLSLLSFQMVDN
ncbi:MAG: hypothetical protein EOM46_29205 [Gammaproteobacteria bacterium]|nr:hypothetical protein [Gammaproteobacteria bacterium]